MDKITHKDIDSALKVLEALKVKADEKMIFSNLRDIYKDKIDIIESDIIHLRDEIN